MITTADFPFEEPIDNVEEYDPDQGEHIVATFTNDAKECTFEISGLFVENDDVNH